MRRSEEPAHPDGGTASGRSGVGTTPWSPAQPWTPDEPRGPRGGAHATVSEDWTTTAGAWGEVEDDDPAPGWSDALDLAGLRAPAQERTAAGDRGTPTRVGRPGGALRDSAAGGGLRETLSSPASALEFARRHLAIVVVALVVAVGIAATHLFRAGSQAVPVGAAIATPASTGAGTGTGGTAPTASGSGRAAASASAGYSASGGPSASAAGVPTNPNLTVQVLGPVRHPGVVTLHPGSRVKDAIMVCGGLLPGADPAELNLAAPLQDADQVIIGTRSHPRGEVRRGTDGQDAGSPASADTDAAPGAATGTSGSVVVNLNTATLAQLDAIPGVGPVTAQKIVDWRTQHGRFTSANELQEVDGIGAKTFARIAPHVTV